MRSDGVRLYTERKCGMAMDRKYVFSHYAPSLIVFLIVMTLVFVMVFISSMTGAIDRMIVLLGCGSIVTDSYVDVSSFTGAKIDEVKEGNGIAYTSSGRSLVHLKAVKAEEYFSGERGEGLRLEKSGEKYKNEIIVSSTLASSLSLSPGERLTLLLYDEKEERARPLLMTVGGIYSSGYAQLDRYLAFVDISLVEGESGYEILLPREENVDKVLSSLRTRGIHAQSYREKYSFLSDNVDQSVMILYVILIFVALLAAFFSCDIAHVYTSRDSRDIASLRLMGLSESSIRGIYRRMTLLTVAISSSAGTICGILLSFLSPSLIAFVAAKEPQIVEYYISSFTLSLPVPSILLMLLLMLLSSYATLSIELYRTRGRELLSQIRQQ